MSSMWWRQEATTDARWRPTAVLTQAVLMAALALFAAILARRVDLLVLATPFVVVVAWSVLTRPKHVPRLDLGLAPTLVQEGQSTRWHAHLTGTPEVDQVVTMMSLPTHAHSNPPHGEVVIPAEGGEADVRFDVQSARWGRRRVGDAVFSCVSPWNAFKLGPFGATGPEVLTTPSAELFTLAAPAPHPDGLVGLNRSRQRGDGSEFADIRLFRTGDRLRHIHWPVSARTGQLHVRTTYAEQDAEVHLVVDATQEVGESGGIDGAPSSADLSVRAAAALARHLLQRGERVGLTAYGAESVQLPVGLGQRQLRRVVDTLATLRLVRVQARRSAAAAPVRAGSGALIILFTPLVGRDSINQALRLSSHGHTVIVVDCLPPDVSITGADEDPSARRAWRLRLLEREADLAGLQQLGIPVVPWRGPGSLDLVLQRLASRPRPRVPRR